MKQYAKKCIAATCILCMIASMSACVGEKTQQTGASAISNTSSTITVDEIQTIAEDKIISSNDDKTIAAVTNKLDAKSIYSKLNYVPQMFYGCYAMDGGFDFPVGSDTINKYLEDMDYWSADNFCVDYENELTKIPFRMDAGPCTLASKLSDVTDHYWMSMYFQSESGHIETVTGAYTISGNILKFTPLKSYKEDGDEVTYELSDKNIEYTFSFNGPDVTISFGGKSVVLTARGMASSYNHIVVNNYKSDSSDSISNIEAFDIYSSVDEYDAESQSQHFNLKLSNNETISNATCEFSTDGLFTFSWKNEKGNDEVYQFVYFYCENDGLVLTDGFKNYFYNDSYSMRNKDILGSSITKADEQKLGELNEEQIQIIVEKRTNLLDDLQNSLTNAGVKINIDKSSGEIMLDSTVLFGYDDSELSNDGKAFLKKFLKAYTDVILQDEYKDFVSKVMVEGHTDSSGNEDYNKKLSKSRADNVKNYCLSEQSGLDSETKASLKKLLESVGKASSEPVLDKKGKEDKEASRRVTFKFIINLDNIEE